MVIIRTEDLGAFKTIHVQNPSSDQDGGPLVALGEPLSAGHSISKNRSSFNGILEALVGGEPLATRSRSSGSSGTTRHPLELVD